MRASTSSLTQQAPVDVSFRWRDGCRFRGPREFSQQVLLYHGPVDCIWYRVSLSLTVLYLIGCLPATLRLLTE
eukprot:235747-Hanusia_phi.AAC.3